MGEKTRMTGKTTHKTNMKWQLMWELTLRELRRSAGNSVPENWLDSIKLEDYSDGKATILCSGKYEAEEAEIYREALDSALSKAAGSDVKVIYEPEKRAPKGAKKVANRWRKGRSPKRSEKLKNGASEVADEAISEAGLTSEETEPNPKIDEPKALSTDEEPSVREELRKRRWSALFRDAALFVFLASVLTGGLIVMAATEDERIECVIMYMVMAAGIIFAAYRFQYMAVVVGGLQTFFFTAYKAYRMLSGTESASWISYLWLGLPLLSICSLLFFMSSSYRAELEMERLDSRLREMAVQEPVTGLYNLKSMYVDLERQIAYAKRNKLSLALLLIELRYPQELKSILTSAQFDRLRLRLAEYVEDQIRLEDRIYAIDDKGSLGIICTCDKAGAEIMKRRIKKAIDDKAFFSDITDRAVRIEVRAGCYEFSDKISNGMELKQKAENELQYDV